MKTSRPWRFSSCQSSSLLSVSEEQELALNILEVIDPDLQSKLFVAVGESTTNPELSKLANRKEFENRQRIEAEAMQWSENNTKSKNQNDEIKSGVDKQQSQDSDDSYCDEQMKPYDSDTWRIEYLKNTEIGTWHVFVASLSPGTSEEKADKCVAKGSYPYQQKI